MIKMLKEPTLDALFDNAHRVRLLKLFLYNPDQNFDAKTIAGKLRINPRILRKQLKKLVELGFIKRRALKSKKVFSVNQNFDFYESLRALVVKTSPAAKDKVLKRILGLGKIKLALISGIFINADNSRADMMIVGDKIKRSKLNRFLRDLEAEVGKEINYAVMDTKEFNYRYRMYDRFIRDLLEFKHEKLINKLRI